MGIGINEFNFLKYSSKKNKFNKTITIGRQQLYFKKNIPDNKISPQYCEELFKKYLLATDVDSIDNSSYEGATFIHDMNEPLPKHLVSCYDTVYDGGALEHIFNISQAIENFSKLLRPGGVVIHCVPANNLCGHGFYQFSPELFFSIYSKENGYSNCEIFLAKVSNSKVWYKVSKPTNKIRNTIRSNVEIQILVRAEKNINKARFIVQQSDYKYQWNIDVNKDDSSSKKLKLKNYIKENKVLYKIIYPMYRYYFWNILVI